MGRVFWPFYFSSFTGRLLRVFSANVWAESTITALLNWTLGKSRDMPSNGLILVYLAPHFGTKI